MAEYPFECLAYCEFYEVKTDKTENGDWIETCQKGINPEGASKCGEIVMDKEKRK